MADRMMNFHSSILQVASIIKNNEQKKSEEHFDTETKKRERKANYTREETNILVALVIEKKDILENKKNGADQWQEKKQAWEDITRAFNLKSGGSNYRDSKTLKIKYESLKRDIKRKWSEIIAKKRNPNGKLPKFTAAENKIKDILQLQFEGFCDFSLTNDKSGDDDDDADSSDSNTNIQEQDWSVKKEIQEVHISNEEILNFEDAAIEFQPKTEEEPPSKRIREDPLTGKQRFNIKSNDNSNSIEDAKLENIRLQNDLLREEMEMKKMQRRMMEEELQHKRTMHELERQHLMLKIQAFKDQQTVE